MTRNLIKILVLLALSPAAARSQDPVLATLESYEGRVEVKQGGGEFVPARVGMEFRADDFVHTLSRSRAAIAFKNGGFLRLAENTSLQFKSPGQSGSQEISLPSGKLYYFGRDPKRSPVVDTPSATTAVRGTEFVLEADSAGTKVAVLNGSVRCFNSQGEVVLRSGEQGLAERGRPPVKGLLIQPLDSVQWALFFPPIVRAEDFGAASTGLQEALAYYRQGDYVRALSALDAYGGPSRGEALVLKAAAALSMGDIEGTKAALDALASLPKAELAPGLQAVALTERAVVALMRNNKDEAARLAEEAISLCPGCPAALLTKSYVAQASFNLQEARAWAEKLAGAGPGDSYAYSRQAELAMGFGEIKLARELARKGRELDPSSSYAQAMDGFAALLEHENAEALAIFTGIVSRDPSYPMAHLGKALAEIGLGNLSEGRRDLERAVFLAPNIAVYRSYLGKAFFEEEREDLAGKEYEQALFLDPQDPTPYLYRAYNRLSQNDPVGALSDVESSIARNNHRAVYRSSLLLDEDLAARTASLGRVFSEMGLPQAAQVEAVKSVQRDYSNYSAHLLLSDSYQTEFLVDSALAEERIANLFAPVAFNLFNRRPVGAAGVGGGANEYDALFDRPENQTNIWTQYSSHDDYLQPGAQFAAKFQDFAFSLENDGIFLDGSKAGNYTRQYRTSLRGAYQLTPFDRLSLDGGVLYQSVSDLNQLQDEAHLESYSTSAAYLHEFGPRSKLIAQAAYSPNYNRYLTHGLARPSVVNEIIGDEIFSTENNLLVDELSRESVDLSSASLQHAYDAEWISAITGAETHFSHVKRRERSPVLGDEMGLFNGIEYFIRTQQQDDLFSADLYSYEIFHLAQWLDITLGGSYSSVRIENREVPPFFTGADREERFNPKFGITLYPTSQITVRSAYFEGLRKSILDDPLSLEPTLVGGINQRFNDYSGTRARSAGLAADYKIPGSTYLGAEGVYRHALNSYFPAASEFNMDYNTMEFSSDVHREDRFDLHQDQKFLRGYLAQIITPRLVSSANYEYSDFERTDPGFGQDLSLHKTVLGMRYFDESGLFPFVRAAWRKQDRSGSDFYDDGTSDFWLVDMGVGYRIPKRHGVVTLEALNVFDRDFVYDQSFGVEPFVRPGFGAAVTASFNF